MYKKISNLFSCPLICQNYLEINISNCFHVFIFLICQNYVHIKPQDVFMSFNWSKVCIKNLGLSSVSLIGRKMYKPKS